jgi:hypothetical protein
MWLRFARRTTTAEATTGIVVVEGRVEAEKTLSIPGSATRPVFCDIAFESFRAVAGGRGRVGWIPDRADIQVVPFVLCDEAGKIWINAERDELVVKGGSHETGTTGRNATGRYSARLIMPGDIIRVRGEVYSPKRAPVERGLRASKDHPLEILFRRRGEAPEPAPEAAPPEKKSKRR